MSRDKIIRIPGDTLMIQESQAEIKYRKKHFPDVKGVTQKKISCTVCNKDISRYVFNGSEIYIHNILGVLVCGDCHSFYGDGCFSMDEDGDDKYCRWCGQGGTLYCCSSCSCAFCKKCIKSNLNRSILDEVDADDWKCFICQPEPLYAVRALCWAASKYYDYINEKKNKRNQGSESIRNTSRNMSEEGQKKRNKRGKEDESDYSPELKRSRLDNSNKKEKIKLRKSKNDSSDDASSRDNSALSQRSKRRRIPKQDQNESENDLTDDNSTNVLLEKDKLRRGNKVKHTKRRENVSDSSESSDNETIKSKKRGDKSNSSSVCQRVRAKRLHRRRSLKGRKYVSNSEESDSTSDDEGTKKKNKRYSKNSSSSDDKETKKKSKRYSKNSISSDHKETKKKIKQYSKKSSSLSDDGKNTTKEKKIVSDSKIDEKKNKNSYSSDNEANNTKEQIITNNEEKRDVLQVCGSWFKESIADLAELGNLISKRAKQLDEKQKLNSCNDLTIAFGKVQKMINGITENLKYINDNTYENNQKFKKLFGIPEDIENIENNVCISEQNDNKIKQEMDIASNVCNNASTNSKVELNEEDSTGKVIKCLKTNNSDVNDIAQKEVDEHNSTHDITSVRDNETVGDNEIKDNSMETDLENLDNTNNSSVDVSKEESVNGKDNQNNCECADSIPNNTCMELDSTINYSLDITDDDSTTGTKEKTNKIVPEISKSSSIMSCAEQDKTEFSADECNESKNDSVSEAVLKAQKELFTSSSNSASSEDSDSEKDDDTREKKKKSKKEAKIQEKDGKQDDNVEVSKKKKAIEGSVEEKDLSSDSDESIDKLIDLKNLKKKKKKKETSDESNLNNEAKEENAEAEDNSDVDSDSDKKPKVKQQNSKEKREDILEYLNKSGDSSTSDVPDDMTSMVLNDPSKCSQEKEEILEKENEDFGLRALIDSSDSEGSDRNESSSVNSDQENILKTSEEKKKKKSKEKENTEGMEQENNMDEEEGEKGSTKDKEEELNDVSDEENEKENVEVNGDNERDKSANESEGIKEGSSEDEFEQSLTIKMKRKKKKEDKLLKTKLSDTDTSDEDRKWRKRKEKEKFKKSEEKDGALVNREKKTNILDTDDEEEKAKDSDDSDSSEHLSLRDISSTESEEIIRKPTKRKKSSSESPVNISSSEEEKKVKKKRKRIKSPQPDDASSGSDTEQIHGQKSTIGESPGKGGRKNIRKLLDKTDLAEATKIAAKEEEDRKKRVAERQKLFNKLYEIPEAAGIEKLVLDFDPNTKEELLSVHPALVSKMKPHQVKGVKFMWDSCFESMNQLKTKKGSGCILAHCMGLGKTFQVISLVHTLITNAETNVKSVLIVCPLSTVLNWYNEFKNWLKDVDKSNEIEVYHLTSYKQNNTRARCLKDWHEEGGVMILGYEMFRNLTPEGKKFKPRLREMFQNSLIDPGPDLIVCDEGHMLKNENTALSKAMTRVQTNRRIILTGTPLQNNLGEYHCMVQFVKPNLLGTRKEFLNRFVNPITNGQFVDSTDGDVRVMKRRAHVLHKMLEGLIQRFDYNVLTPFLPPKHEYVISLRLSEVQIKLYQYYLANLSQRGTGSGLFSDFQVLSRIWTHPLTVKMSTDKAYKDAQKKADEEPTDSEGSLIDFIDDSAETSSNSSSSTNNGSGGDDDTKSTDSVRQTRNTRSTRNNPVKEIAEEKDESKKEEEAKSLAWWDSLIEPEHLEDINQSAKLVLLFAILRECELIADKVLVFSQSLYSLNLIEYFLEKIDSATSEGRHSEPSLANHVGSWSKGLDYFRLDGASSSENRNIWCKTFNSESNARARLFLISTRAGGLGINLVGANRVIIFDASWNPSHDVQSIFRIYRFGQKKPCYIYRFIAQGTMEEKVYDRQVAKLSLSSRVVDEQQAHRHFSHNDLQELYTFTPNTKSDRPVPLLPKDMLMAELLQQCSEWIVAYHEHDSLIEHVIDEELNEEERKLAWEDYEKEKERGFLPAPGQGQIFGMPSIESVRDALKKQNPALTEEQLTIQVKQFMFKLQNAQILKQQQQRQQLQMSQLQQRLMQKPVQVTAPLQFPRRPIIPNAHQSKPFGSGSIPYNKFQPTQIYNYQAQIAYQQQLQMMAQNQLQTMDNRSLVQTKSDAGSQKQKIVADTQRKKAEEKKIDPEVVNLE